MKRIKIVLSFILVLAMVFSLSGNAFAASPTTTVVNCFKNFQYLQQGEASSYVRILQRFLLNYNWTTGNYISSNGGVDGSFGLGTYYATYYFQQAVFSNNANEWDGKVGSKTWEKICYNMDFFDASGEGTVWRFYRTNNLVVERVSNRWIVQGNAGNYHIYV